MIRRDRALSLLLSFFYITNKHTGQSPVFWGDCPLALKQHHANNGRFIKVHNVQSLSSSEICEYEVPLRAYIDSYLHTCQKKNWDGSGAIHLSSWMKPQTEWRIWDTIMYMKCVLPILCGRSEWQNLWKDTFPVSRLTLNQHGFSVDAIRAFRRQLRGVSDVRYFLFRLCNVYAWSFPHTGFPRWSETRV